MKDQRIILRFVLSFATTFIALQSLIACAPSHTQVPNNNCNACTTDLPSPAPPEAPVTPENPNTPTEPTGDLHFEHLPAETAGESTGRQVRFEIPTQKGKSYKLLVVEFDFYISAWTSYQDHDQHGLMQLTRGKGWKSNLIGWIPILGAGKSVVIRNNIDNPANGSGNTRAVAGFTSDQIAAGMWHHAKYTYNPVDREIYLEITQDQGKTLKMLSPMDSNSPSKLVSNFDYLTLTFGTWDGGANGPECNTEGWVFSNIKLRGYE